MPIRFRCGYCNGMVGIARRKAGMDTTCPHCGYTVTVPEAETEAPNDSTREPVDLDEFFTDSPEADVSEPPAASPETPAATERTKAARLSTPHTSQEPVRPPTSVVPKPHQDLPGGPRKPLPTSSAQKPTFTASDFALKDLAEQSPAQKAARLSPLFNPPAASPVPGQIVLSVQKATLYGVLVVILLAVTFAGGYLLGSMK